MSSRLEGRTGIVTGGSRGIGRAIAAAFAREGARVVICGRHQESLEEAANAIGPSAIARACHVGRVEEIQALAEFARKELGRIDILVNNAGTNVAQGPCLEATDAQFDKMIEINLKSAFRLTNAVAPDMCRQRRGAIVNVASISGLRPQHHGMLYSMTKAALIMMTQSWALELGAHGVRVNAIAPGLIQTRLSEYYWNDEQRLARQLERQPVGHLGQPAEIAEAAVMLASDEASYMTGQTLVIDGGLLLAAI